MADLCMCMCVIWASSAYYEASSVDWLSVVVMAVAASSATAAAAFVVIIAIVEVVVSTNDEAR